MEWKEVFDTEFKKDYFIKLRDWVKQRRESHQVIPDTTQIMRVFKETPFDSVKIVIIGQDPYPSNHACGLSFSSEQNDIPDSLKNVFKEIKDDLYKDDDFVFKSPNLLPWTKQGVLLLNRVLTTEVGDPGAHSNQGWEQFTDAVITFINNNKKNVVYMLWGKKAQEVKGLINPEYNLILEAPHPSPLSAHTGFFGCKHFSKANRYLLDVSFVNVAAFFKDIISKDEQKLHQLYKDLDIAINPFPSYVEAISKFVATFPADVNTDIQKLFIINFKN